MTIGTVIALIKALGGGGGGGSDLPAVTSADNGDVLTVVNGSWDKAAPSGGGGVLALNGTIDGNTITLDKTWQEIHDAITAGQFVFLRFSYDREVAVWICYGVSQPDNSCEAWFFTGETIMTFTCVSANDYPSMTAG